MTLRIRAWWRQTLLTIGSSRSTGSHPTGIDSSLELFEGLSERELKQARRVLTVTDIRPGKVICRQGDVGRNFAIVLEGQVAVIHNQTPLAVLEPGCHFGELPMIHSAHAPFLRASFHALGPATIAVANRREFRTLLDWFPLVAERIVEMSEIRLAFIDDLDAQAAETTDRDVEAKDLERKDVVDIRSTSRAYPVHRLDAHFA